MAVPFRWSIAKREQLGDLTDDVISPSLIKHNFLDDLRQATAQILAFSGGADLIFIGRTPENFYDYLSGVFQTVSEAPELHLLHFSMRWAGAGGVAKLDAKKLEGLFEYFESAGLSGRQITKRNRGLALVDFVAHGGTMETVIKLLHLNTKNHGGDWPAVARKLRIIGLRIRTHNSPNTWRWQQHQDWLDLIRETPIKNVSAPAHFLYHIANTQEKVTGPFHYGRWDGEDTDRFPPTDTQRAALAFAVKLFDAGNSRNERHALSRLLARTAQMRDPAIRALALKLKQG